MSFKAEVVADSINELGNRITTMVVTFPRIILAEFNTHRMFSRNSASSRAIPFEKLLKSVYENPFTPIAWQKNHKGMQGTEYWTEDYEVDSLNEGWLRSRDLACHTAEKLFFHGQGVTKQLCNRLLEPFMWHTVIVTATEWENFFALRCPQYQMDEAMYTARSRKDAICVWSNDDADLQEEMEKYTELEWLQMNKGAAEIHMMKIAELMWDAMNESTPRLLRAGQWHIPFHSQIDDTSLQLDYLDILNKRFDSPPLDLKFPDAGTEGLVKISTTMCARTSYTVVGEDLKPLSYTRLAKLHDELEAANPKHMSPFEHCAKNPENEDYINSSFGWWGNFKGWIQYRKMISGENITK
jgi:thymidylate synthase ThyX